MEQERKWVDPLLQKLEDLKLPPPPYPKRVFVKDDDTPGFGLYLTERGKLTFFYERRPIPRQTFRGTSAGEARKWAAKLELQREAGTFAPKPRKQASYDHKTLRRAAHEFVGSRPPTYKSGPALLASLEKNAEPLMGRPIESLGRSEMTRLGDEVAASAGRHAADRMIKNLNAVGRWYQDRTDNYTWPMVRSPLTKEDHRGRDRVLEDHEIAALWRGADRAGAFGKYAQFLLLTGLRRDEAAFLRREEVDPGYTRITLGADRIKTRVALTLPLSQATADLLRSLPPDGELFFPRWSVSSKAALDRLVNIPHWTLHDCRRTAATLMERAGVLPHVIDKVLNHVTRGVAGVYARHNYIEEKRDALERLATLVSDITK
jgi:integrase